MKFLYRFRTKHNEVQEGVVFARDRDAAFAQLRHRHINAEKVWAAPGLFNSLLGTGKRWMAIALLTVASLVLLMLLLSSNGSGYASSKRSQIYADPSILQAHDAREWRDVFDSPSDIFLVQFAIPGRAVVHVSPPSSVDMVECASRLCRIYDNDPVEVVQMKRMLNGLKDELRRYLDAGGTVELYVERLIERQRAEILIYEDVVKSIDRLRGDWRNVNLRPALIQKWNEKNEYLIDMGLQGVPLPNGWVE